MQALREAYPEFVKKIREEMGERQPIEEIKMGWQHFWR